MSASNKHAGTGAAGTQPAIPEPSLAERARTLLHLGRVQRQDHGHIEEAVNVAEREAGHPGDAFLQSINTEMISRFNIHHVTVQIETQDLAGFCTSCD